MDPCAYPTAMRQVRNLIETLETGATYSVYNTESLCFPSLRAHIQIFILIHFPSLFSFTSCFHLCTPHTHQSFFFTIWIWTAILSLYSVQSLL